MGQWIDVAATSDVPSGRGKTVSAGTRRLALFNDGDRFYALDDACPHQGASLATGTLHGGRVICPLHSWVFDLETGACPRGTHEPTGTYPVRVTGDRVQVEIPVQADDAVGGVPHEG